MARPSSTTTPACVKICTMEPNVPVPWMRAVPITKKLMRLPVDEVAMKCVIESNAESGNADES